MHRIRARLSFANVVSLIALFVALGGSSYAAVTLVRNSVGAKQIKAGAVRSSEVKNGSLLRKDFKAGQLPAGDKGDTGAQGPQGPAGATGAPGTARAFARVQVDGTLETGFVPGTLTVPQVKGVDQTDVQHAAPGTYCFGGLGFEIASAMVSADSAGAATTTDQIASVAIQRGNTIGTCDADHQQARVVMFDVSDGRAVDARFTIWFE